MFIWICTINGRKMLLNKIVTKKCAHSLRHNGLTNKSNKKGKKGEKRGEMEKGEKVKRGKSKKGKKGKLFFFYKKIESYFYIY
jgi:hypothetical protein